MTSSEAKELWNQVEALRSQVATHGEDLSALNEWKRWADEKIKMVCHQLGYWFWRFALLAVFGGGAGSFAFSWAG